MGVLVNKTDDNYVDPTQKKATEIIMYIFIGFIVLLSLCFVYLANMKYNFIKFPKTKFLKTKFPKTTKE